MIRAMIFDLDGTLVKTEMLKALSYVRAVRYLRPAAMTDDHVLEEFNTVGGLPRREVASRLMHRFGIQAAAEQRMGEFGVDTPWQAFVQLRLRYYHAMMADADMLRSHVWPHTMVLLAQARRMACKTALATMSGCAVASHILEVLSLGHTFDFVATRDDVKHGKPDTR